MSDQNDDETSATYASPACLLHELDPDYAGLTSPVDARRQADVRRWRTAERRRLIDDRLAIDAVLRRRNDERIATRLDAIVGPVGGLAIGAYWPVRGEPDLRAWMKRASAQGARCALPVVVGRDRPLVFRAWTPGARLERGAWDIPVPAAGPEVTPDVVIVPVLGFDRACHRLGYGGGFFDRTLAILPVKPRILGVGYSQAALPTIHPQAHDIPMDAVVTEDGIFSRQA